uniref:pituitary tumor-transforming gene 1 protein-interacting protein n=1 Tax=Euleptes europaea TaxID=460621 RepID=UPI00253FBFAF|nr:pituitary tumor-transforming gene 1 protein-interacting protein [Euleptes europaea]
MGPCFRAALLLLLLPALEKAAWAAPTSAPARQGRILVRSKDLRMLRPRVNLDHPSSYIPEIRRLPYKSIGCDQYTNKSCEACLKNVTCLWCTSNKKCIEYPVRSILPPSSVCALSSARWGVCGVNFEALIITMSVVGGGIIIALCVCCCCCCRKKKSINRPDKEEEKAVREKEQRRVKQEERRAEMKSRHDEIRKKYGLFKEENPYAKFENN